MDAAIVVMRLFHVVLGAAWLGMVVFTAFFLSPAVAETGPDGGKVMAALQRRGVMTVMPILALATLLSGVWLYWRFSAGFAAGYVNSPMGRAYAIGGAAAIVAYGLGIAVMRPAMLRAMTLVQTLGPAAPEVVRLRTRSTRVGRLVAVLLLGAAAAMAVGRYV